MLDTIVINYEVFEMGERILELDNLRNDISKRSKKGLDSRRRKHLSSGTDLVANYQAGQGNSFQLDQVCNRLGYGRRIQLFPNDRVIGLL